MGYIIDGPSQVITLTAGTTSVSVRDLWSRWVDWFLTGDNSKYLPAFRYVGGDDIDIAEGTTIPIYSYLVNGWRIKPQEANHTLSLKDGILLVDGGGDPFNDTDGAYVVRIKYQQPVQAISFSTGGSGLSIEEQTRLLKIYQALMLDPTAPVTTTESAITFDDVEIDLVGDPNVQIVGTRKP